MSCVGQQLILAAIVKRANFSAEWPPGAFEMHLSSPEPKRGVTLPDLPVAGPIFNN
jgi:hypothetical protein